MLAPDLTRACANPAAPLNPKIAGSKPARPIRIVCGPRPHTPFTGETMFPDNSDRRFETRPPSLYEDDLATGSPRALRNRGPFRIAPCTGDSSPEKSGRRRSASS